MDFKPFKFGGFNTDGIVQKVTDKARDRQLGVAQEKVESLRCPDHGKAVTISMEGTGATRKLIVMGCCDAVRKQAMALIRQR